MFNPTTSPGGGLHFLRSAEAAASSLAIQLNAILFMMSPGSECHCRGRAAAKRRSVPSAGHLPCRPSGGPRLFAAAILLSAALLFGVQPMFTKMVPPQFGGAPAVWSVAIVFFQSALLAGYAYAHWLTRYTRGSAAGAIHLAVMIAACLLLPLSVGTTWNRPPAGLEALWLILRLSAEFLADLGWPPRPLWGQNRSRPLAACPLPSDWLGVVTFAAVSQAGTGGCDARNDCRSGDCLLR